MVIVIIMMMVIIIFVTINVLIIIIIIIVIVIRLYNMNKAIMMPSSQKITKLLLCSLWYLHNINNTFPLLCSA